MIEHGGNWQGFACDISRYPDDNLTVVVLTNLDVSHSDPDLLAHVITGFVDPPLSPATLTPQVIAGARATLANLWPGGSLTLVKRFAPPDATAPLIAVFCLTKADSTLIGLVLIDPDGKISSFRFLPNREYQ